LDPDAVRVGGFKSGQFKSVITRVSQCLQCFDAVGWAAGTAFGLQKSEWWDSGVVICLGEMQICIWPS